MRFIGMADHFIAKFRIFRPEYVFHVSEEIYCPFWVATVHGFDKALVKAKGKAPKCAHPILRTQQFSHKNIQRSVNLGHLLGIIILLEGIHPLKCCRNALDTFFCQGYRPLKEISHEIFLDLPRILQEKEASKAIMCKNKPI